jgi:hypothetical protein
VEPKFKVPERPSKLDPFADRLSAWLKVGLAEDGIQEGPQAEAHPMLFPRMRKIWKNG